MHPDESSLACGAAGSALELPIGIEITAEDLADAFDFELFGLAPGRSALLRLNVTACAARCCGEGGPIHLIGIDFRGPRRMPSMAFFETRSESAVSASLHFSSA